MKGLYLGIAAWLGAKSFKKKTNEYFKEQEKTGRQKDGCPGDHVRQNKQAKAAIRY